MTRGAEHRRAAGMHGQGSICSFLWHSFSAFHAPVQSLLKARTVLFLLSWAHREIQEKQRYPLHGNSKLESHEVHFEKHHKPKDMRSEHLAQRGNCGWTKQAQAEPQRKHSYKRWKQSPYFYVILYYRVIKEMHFNSGVRTIQCDHYTNILLRGKETLRYVKHEHPRCKARSSLATSHHMRTISTRPTSWRQTSQSLWRNSSRSRCLTPASETLGKWLPLLLPSPDCTASCKLFYIVFPDG